MARAVKQKKDEGAQFVRHFAPLLDALRGLGGSGTPDEVVEKIAKDLNVPDDVQNELLKPVTAYEIDHAFFNEFRA